MPSLRRLFRPRPHDCNDDAASLTIDFTELDLGDCKPRRPAEEPPHISPTSTNLFETFPRVAFGGYKRYYEALREKERAMRNLKASEPHHSRSPPPEPEFDSDDGDEPSAETDSDAPHSPLPPASIRRAKPFEPALGAIEELLVDDDPWSWHTLPLPNLRASNSLASASTVSKRARRRRRTSSGSYGHSPRHSPRNSIIGTPAPILRKKPRIRRGSIQISTKADIDDERDWPEYLRPYSHSPSSSVSSSASSSEEGHTHWRARSHGDYISQ